MTVPTANLTINLTKQDGTVLAGATVTANLTGPDTYNGNYVSPLEVSGVSDVNGIVVLALFPNVLGARGTRYTIKCVHPTTEKVILNTSVQLPNNACNLVNLDPSGVYDPADQVQINANAAAVSATASAASAAAAAASLASMNPNLFARVANNLSDLANAATARTNLGLGTAAVAALNSILQVANNLSDVTNAATARGNLGLGSIATQNANAVAITAGTITGITGTAGFAGLTASGTIAAAAFTGPLTGNVTGNVSGSSGSTTGNAATATALQTSRTINGTGFDGTTNITVTAAAGTLTGAALAAGVTASSLTSLGTIAALVAGTGTFTGAITPAQVAGIVGTTTNNDAAAGSVGEVITATFTSFAAPASTQAGDAASIALTGGDYDIEVHAELGVNEVANVTRHILGLSTNSGNSFVGLTQGTTRLDYIVPGANSNMPANITIRVPLGAPATYYVKYSATYTGTAPTATGIVTARRRR